MNQQQRAEQIETRHRTGIISLQEAAAEYMPLFREALDEMAAAHAQVEALTERVERLEDLLDVRKLRMPDRPL